MFNSSKVTRSPNLCSHLILPDTFLECTCPGCPVDSAFHPEHGLTAEQSQSPLLRLSTHVVPPTVVHLANAPDDPWRKNIMNVYCCFFFMQSLLLCLAWGSRENGKRRQKKKANAEWREKSYQRWNQTNYKMFIFFRETRRESSGKMSIFILRVNNCREAVVWKMFTYFNENPPMWDLTWMPFFIEMHPCTLSYHPRIKKFVENFSVTYFHIQNRLFELEHNERNMKVHKSE